MGAINLLLPSADRWVRAFSEPRCHDAFPGTAGSGCSEHAIRCEAEELSPHYALTDRPELYKLLPAPRLLRSHILPCAPHFQRSKPNALASVVLGRLESITDCFGFPSWAARFAFQVSGIRFFLIFLVPGSLQFTRRAGFIRQLGGASNTSRCLASCFCEFSLSLACRKLAVRRWIVLRPSPAASLVSPPPPGAMLWVSPRDRW